MKKLVAILFAGLLLAGCAHFVNLNNIAGLMVGSNQIGLIVNKGDKPDKLAVYDAVMINGRLLMKYVGYLDKDGNKHPAPKGKAAVYEPQPREDGSIYYSYAGYLDEQNQFHPVGK